MTISYEVLAEVLGKTATEVADTLNAAKQGETVSPDEVANWFRNEIKSKFGRIQSEGFTAGRKDSKIFDEKIKAYNQKIAEKVGIELVENLDDFIESIVAQSKKVKDKDVQISDKDILTHPLFLKTKGDAEAKVLALQQDFDKFKQLKQQEDSLSKLRENSLMLLEKGGFDLPTDPTIKGNLTNAFISTIANLGYRYEFDQNGAAKIFDADNNLVKDKLMEAVSFESFITENAKGFFQLKQGQVGQTPANQAQPPNSGGASMGGFKFTKPKDQQEAFETLYSIKNPEEKAAYNTYLKEFLN